MLALHTEFLAYLKIYIARLQYFPDQSALVQWSVEKYIYVKILQRNSQSK